MIICEDIDNEALATLIVNKMRGTIKVCAVKAPDFGDRRKLIMEDIAVLTGGLVISPEKGMKLSRVDKAWLGEARKANIQKESTTIIDGKGEVEATVLIVDQIEDKLNHALTLDKQKKVTICVHPFIAAYLRNGLASRRMKWFFKYKKWVNIRPIYAYHLLQYAFFDKNDDEISL